MSSTNRSCSLSAGLNRTYLADEGSILERLLPLARSEPALKQKIEGTARSLAENVRARQQHCSGLHAFLNHYDLSSHEGRSPDVPGRGLVTGP